MPELPQLPQIIADQASAFPWLTFAFALLLPAVLSWGTLETIKRTFLARWKMIVVTTDAIAAKASDSVLTQKIEREKGWWLPMLWFLAVAIGFGVGAVVGVTADWKALWGGLTGACGGALSSFLVALLKKTSRKVADAAVGKLITKIGMTDHTKTGIPAMTDEDLSGGGGP